MTDEQVRIRDLEQSNAELRSALIVAGREIIKTHRWKKNLPILILPALTSPLPFFPFADSQLWDTFCAGKIIVRLDDLVRFWF